MTVHKLQSVEGKYGRRIDEIELQIRIVGDSEVGRVDKWRWKDGGRDQE